MVTVFFFLKKHVGCFLFPFKKWLCVVLITSKGDNGHNTKVAWLCVVVSLTKRKNGCVSLSQQRKGCMVVCRSPTTKRENGCVSFSP